MTPPPQHSPAAPSHSEPTTTRKQAASSGRVLFVDDDAELCDLAKMALTASGFSVETCTTAARALIRAETEEFDVLLTDLHLGDMDGLTLCGRVREMRPDLPVVVVTAFGSMGAAVDAIRAGAHDFVTKPIEMDALAHHVRRAVEHRRLNVEVAALREVVRKSHAPENMIGESRAMTEVYDIVRRVAATDVGVMVTGETGTGKELIARAIHGLSDRHEGPFVALNCAALPETLLESELFGHARGAFTDAKQARRGLFVEASGGTLLLDEIGEMTPAVQAKVLRAIQERVVRPVGDSRELPFDTRIIASTHRNLEEMIEEGEFREDLYYRLNVVHLPLPPLRSRGNDTLLLAQAFIDRFATRHGVPVVGIQAPAAARLMAYDWPGNVRELENCIERAVALTRFEKIGVEDLPPRVREHTPRRLPIDVSSPDELLSMREMERRYILAALDTVGGNRTRASELLGLDRKTLYRKLKQYEESGDDSP
ncbi:MAG: sigma-54-dependent Fis family transcriptional regulator [Deltaproteobacteria bacterium]|nr:sigma-54-dependent Fis family transcriptional regulator [Deltaproteobacteria bacterium]